MNELSAHKQNEAFFRSPIFDPRTTENLLGVKLQRTQITVGKETKSCRAWTRLVCQLVFFPHIFHATSWELTYDFTSAHSIDFVTKTLNCSYFPVRVWIGLNGHLYAEICQMFLTVSWKTYFHSLRPSFKDISITLKSCFVTIIGYHSLPNFRRDNFDHVFFFLRVFLFSQ